LAANPVSRVTNAFRTARIIRPPAPAGKEFSGRKKPAASFHAQTRVARVVRA
jgi:hypothetical protein